MTGERMLIAVIDGQDGAITEALEAALPEAGEPPLIVTAGDAREGSALLADLAHARVRLPDLLVIDLGLPGAAGRDLVAQARREGALAGCPILAIGGATAGGPVRQLPNVSALPPLRSYADFVRLSRVVQDLLAHAGSDPA
jgi:CheY-like chemotaxis protein